MADLNRRFSALHREHGFGVLSVIEDRKTTLAGSTSSWFGYRVKPVEMESAYPGYGDFFITRGKDHITANKPESLDDEVFTRTVTFLDGILRCPV